MAQINFAEPPLTGNELLDRYLMELHQRIFGRGEEGGVLDKENVDISGLDIITDHGGLTGLGDDDHLQYLTNVRHSTAFDSKHNALTGGHRSLQQATDPANATISGVSVTSPDANETYGVEEATLINELKADMNNHIVEYNILVGKLNTLLANMRIANLIV